MKRLRAWPETNAAARTRAIEEHYSFIAVDNRLLFYNLEFYGFWIPSHNMAIKAPPDLAMWSLNASPAHHANLTRALPDTDEPVLILSQHHDFEKYFREDFETLTEMEPIKIDLGPGKSGRKIRHLKVWRGTGYKRTSREDRH